MQTEPHITVFETEAVAALEVQPGEWYVDGTFGGGGHTRRILDEGGRVIAFDFDKQAIERGQAAFSEALTAGTLVLVRENFNKLQTEITCLQNAGTVGAIRGVLFDFGTSTTQLMSGERGFSFLEDGELDMRMDTRLGVTAKDLLAVVPENQLAALFAEYGGEHEAKRIAKAIKRSPTPITTTSQLAELVERVKGRRQGKLHPATKVFQALRIAVNSELESIKEALPQALEVLSPGGVLVTIAFHEGEDRLVKQQSVAWQEQHKGTIETKKPLSPNETAVASNPRARSAKLRIFRKS